MEKRQILIFILISLIVFIIGIAIGGYFMSQIFSESELTEQEESFYGRIKQTEFKVPAIDHRGNGVVITLETNLRAGSGLVLVNINDITAGYTTQHSARTAIKAVESYLNRNLENFDIIYNIKADADFVDGPSIGGAMAISLASLIEEKTINRRIGITGSIDEGGIIGPASGIEQKAHALKEEGFEKMLISDQIFLERDYVRKRECSFVDGREYCKISYIEDGELMISQLRVLSIRSLRESLEIFYEN